MNIESVVPFRRPPVDAGSFPAIWKGTPPAWLRGSVVRTCPAVFKTDGWESKHWFDGLGAMFAFRIGPESRVDWHMLDCEFSAHAREGRADIASFGTPMHRPLWKRLMQPAPHITDNVNVNVQPFGPGGHGLVAMTEASKHADIDFESLAVKGWIQYDDTLGHKKSMSAHPMFDTERRMVLNIAQEFGPRPECVLYQHAPGNFKREVVGRWAAPELPYVHSFGLTPRHAVLIGHPLLVNPLKMLFSDKPFIEHFRWQPKRGTRLVVFDRAGSAPRIAETDACFVFHIANAFDDGDDVVLDALAYPDTRIIDQLSIAKLAAGLPLNPDYVRMRIPRTGRATFERRMSPGFEFPAINYGRASGRRHAFCWGTDPWKSPERSVVYKLDVEKGTTQEAPVDKWVIGEPLFVPAPDASKEDAGVLLAVGSHRTRDACALFVMDAATLDVLASAEAEVNLPLGFHGTFVRA